MLKKATVPVLGLLIVVLAGCASTQSSGMPPANVNGTWTGSMAGGASTYTLVLNQSGTRVTGNLTGAGTADGPVEGIVDGNTIKLRDQGGPSETPALTVKGNQITGFIRGRTLTLNRMK
ncbi:MAG TPA: hypothetical protein VIF11_02290 [Methylomirabilota bacterium]|jgi:hypothetical protein